MARLGCVMTVAAIMRFFAVPPIDASLSVSEWSICSENENPSPTLPQVVASLFLCVISR